MKTTHNAPKRDGYFCRRLWKSLCDERKHCNGDAHKEFAVVRRRLEGIKVMIEMIARQIACGSKTEPGDRRIGESSAVSMQSQPN